MPLSRTRSRGAFSPSVMLAYGQNPSTAITTFSMSGSSGTTEVFKDDVISGFAKKSARGDVFCNPMQSTYESRSWQEGSYTYVIPNGYTNVNSGNVLQYQWGIRGNLRPNLNSYLDIAAISAHAGVQAPSLQGFVSAAEFGKTVDMYKKAGEFASRICRAAKGSGSPGQFFNDMSKNWLEYRYGWRTHVMDMQGALRGLKNMQRRPPRKTSRGFSGQDWSRTEKSQYSGSGMTFGIIDVYTEKLSVRSGILYEEIPQDFFTEFGNEFGLTVNHIPESAWELVPFSFVVDWFINVGDWLQAIRPKPGVNILCSWTKYEYLCYVESHLELIRAHTDGNPYTCTSYSGSAQRLYRYRERIPSASIPLVPSSGTGINLFRGLDAASLGFQNLRRMLR